MPTTRKSLLLVLLGGSLTGFAQQPSQPLEQLFAAAQKAQTSGDYATAVSDYTRAAQLRPDMPIIWANLGLSQQEAGNIPAAIQAFQRANRLDSSLYVPNLFLGIDYAHTGKAEQAIPVLTKAEKANPADAQAPLALGRAYISAREYGEAVPQLNRALALNPELGTAWFDLGIAQLDEVESDARTISEENKQSPFAGALYAESLVKQARFGEAANLYKSLLDQQPQPPCLRSEMGFALIREHDESEAEAAFTTERSAHPECGLAILGLGRIAADRGDTNQAFSLLRQLWGRDHGFFACSAGRILNGMAEDEQSRFIAQWSDETRTLLPPELRQGLLKALNGEGECSAEPDGNSPSIPLHAAEKYYTTGQFGACVESLQRGGTPESAEKLRLLAECSFLTGDNRSAARAAIALRHHEPHSLEAIYWSIQANERLAFQSLARFQQLEPDSVRSHVLLGDIYQQLQRFDEAQAEYQKALAFSPSNRAAMLGLASAYLSNYNSPGAMHVAQAALAQAPDDPELNLVMAQALMNQHEYAEAEPYLNKSLNAKPQMLARIHALIGKAYAETGRTREAIEELQRGKSSDEDGSVQYLLARLYRKLGDVKDSRIALERMAAIKRQREARGVRRVEDPDLSPLEETARATMP